jgi:hypothetical protein
LRTDPAWSGQPLPSRSRVAAFLTVKPNGVFELGGYGYYLGKQWAERRIEENRSPPAAHHRVLGFPSIDSGNGVDNVAYQPGGRGS